MLLNFFQQCKGFAETGVWRPVKNYMAGLEQPNDDRGYEGGEIPDQELQKFGNKMKGKEMSMLVKQNEEGSKVGNAVEICQGFASICTQFILCVFPGLRYLVFGETLAIMAYNSLNT